MHPAVSSWQTLRAAPRGSALSHLNTKESKYIQLLPAGGHYKWLPEASLVFIWRRRESGFLQLIVGVRHSLKAEAGRSL